MPVLLNEYLRSTFGCKVYKIAIDGGFTCPNRDGTIDTRGCIFCSAGGSGDFAEPCNGRSVTEQIEAGKKRVAGKIREGKYIAYFQAYTNTYGPLEKLRSLFTEAINHPDVAALSVGTRPDCLPPETVVLLSELNKRKPVWVELGLQTIHPRSAEYIRRGYDLAVFDDAVKRLKEAGLSVVVHVILGLPGETKEQMLETVKYVGESGADGIKLQLLHVLRGTDLAAEYEAGKVPVMETEEYVDLVVDCLRVLPQNMIVHRMTGDGRKRDLLAPLWSGDKKRVMNLLKSKIKAAGIMNLE